MLFFNYLLVLIMVIFITVHYVVLIVRQVPYLLEYKIMFFP